VGLLPARRGWQGKDGIVNASFRKRKQVPNSMRRSLEAQAQIQEFIVGGAHAMLWTSILDG